METIKEKIKPTAFAKLKEQIGKSDKGNWTYFKGSLNVNDVWCTVIAKPTKTGDLMIELFAKKGV